MTREDVISWLEHLSDDARSKADSLVPTNIEIACCVAIDALKAQEPRVMTLEEVLATEVVYAEDIDKAEIIPVLVSRRSHDRIVLVRAHLMGGPSHVIYPLISEYGKRWRCWTSRPTDAQREATPWQTM